MSFPDTPGRRLGLRNGRRRATFAIARRRIGPFADGCQRGGSETARPADAVLRGLLEQLTRSRRARWPQTLDIQAAPRAGGAAAGKARRRGARRGVAGRRRPGRSGTADDQGAEGAAGAPTSWCTTAWSARRSWIWPRRGRGASVVAKRKSRHSYAQDEINRLLVAFAREGLTVVRLKGGDPFIFGRGGEELEACRAAGVACAVVPGVTAALAAAARRPARR